MPLVLDTTFASDNILHFSKNLLEKKKLVMAIDDNIRDEKLEYDINKEAARWSGLSSCKIDKCEYLTDEELLPPDQRSMIEHAKSSNNFQQ